MGITLDKTSGMPAFLLLSQLRFSSRRSSIEVTSLDDFAHCSKHSPQVAPAISANGREKGEHFLRQRAMTLRFSLKVAEKRCRIAPCARSGYRTLRRFRTRAQRKPHPGPGSVAAMGARYYAGIRGRGRDRVVVGCSLRGIARSTPELTVPEAPPASWSRAGRVLVNGKKSRCMRLAPGTDGSGDRGRWRVGAIPCRWRPRPVRNARVIADFTS